MPEVLVVPVECDADIVTARQRGRELCVSMGLAQAELTFVATAISEVARNILKYAGRGEVTFPLGERQGRRFLEVVAADRGPGIADVGLALQDGYSTADGLGLGLPGAKRLMDELEIHSALGEGTRVTMRKWTP